MHQNTKLTLPANCRKLRKAAAILFAGALGIALYLAWKSLADTPPAGCGAGSGCSEVMQSRWSVVAGMPVSIAGALVYALLLILALRAPSGRLPERSLSILVLGAAAWFGIVQAFLLGAFCPWCTAAHLLAAGGVCLLWGARRSMPEEADAPRSGVPAWAVPFAAVTGMIVLQSTGKAPERIQERTLTHAVSTGPGSISLYQGRLNLDPALLPTIGVPGAAVTAVVLSDFTCPHCRELHQTLSELAAQRPGQFGAVLLPGAFEPEARELHRIMLSLWHIDPAGYQETVERIFDGSLAPRPDEVLAAVQKLTSGKFYEEAWKHATPVEATLRQGAELMALNASEAGSSTLPQIMIRDRVLTGAPQTATLAGLLDSDSPPPVPPAAAPAIADPAAAPGLTGPAAVLTFESPTVDLGSVTRGETLTKKVSFINSGTAPLEITAIKASCGCTTVQGAQQTVPPGQSGSFELKFDSTRFMGAVTKTVDVESNAAGGKVRLKLIANVWSPVTLNPSVIAFGSVLKGTPVPPRVIEVNVTEPGPLTLGTVTCSNLYFQVEAKTLEAGRKYQLTVSVPELGEKPQNAEITLPLEHPKMKEVKVMAYINPVDALMVQPAQVTLSTPSLSSPPQITVFCHDPEIPTLEVTDLAWTGGGNVGVTFERQGSNRWGRIHLAFPEGYTPSAAGDASVTFHTNHPRFPQMTVPVRFLSPTARQQPKSAEVISAVH